jgi:hypothetical protein
LQFHVAEAVEYCEHNGASRDGSKKDLEHDEILQLHLPNDDAGLKDARLFQCKAKNNAHDKANGYGESDRHGFSPFLDTAQ